MSAEISSEVKTYLERSNRPFSAIDVFNNMNTKDNKQSKTAITRALEELARNKQIVEKVNGKQKIYFADQNNFQDIDDNKRQQIDQQLDQLRDQSKQIKKELNSKETTLSALKATLTSEEVSKQLRQLKEEIQQMENKLESIDSKAKDLKPEENEKIKSERNKLVTEWRKRKRLADNMIDQMVEPSNKKKKDLIEQIGVETDEDFDVKLPQN